MIEQIEGKHETVHYDANNVYKLYMNSQVENYPAHWHTAVEIILPTDNEYRVICNNVDYHLNVGDILVIAPGALHELIAPAHGKRTILQADFTPLNYFKDAYAMVSSLEPARLITRDTFPNIYDEAYALLNEIQNEYEQNLPLSNMKIFSIITNFFVLLGREFVNETKLFTDSPSPKKEYSDIFLDIIDYINVHCTENLTLEEVAAKAGFSKFHFSRLFNQLTNTTFCHFLNTKRVIYAEKLLSDPSLSITEISYLAGFNSSSSFVRVFKQIKSYTPSDYRKMHDPLGPVSPKFNASSY